MNPRTIMDALLGEEGRIVIHQDDNARHHVEAIDHTEHHDLHRMADDGCPHHDEHPLGGWYGDGGKPLACAIDIGLPRHPFTVEDAQALLAKAKAACEAVPAVLRNSDHGSHLPTDAKARKALPLCTGVLDYFPKAIAAIAEVSRIGNDQHNPGQPLHWAKGKSTDHADCAIRHFAERGTVDTDGGRHTAKAAWRVLAHLEMEIEAEEAGMSYADYIAHLKAQEAA